MIAGKQQTLELQYGKLAGERATLRQKGGGQTLANVERDMQTLAGELKHSAQVLSVNLQQHPGAAENLLKLQGELRYGLAIDLLSDHNCALILVVM